LNQAITTTATPVPPAPNWGSTLRKVALLIQAAVTSARSMVPPAVWARGRDRVQGWIKDRQLTRAKRALEQQLARIVETASGHQAKGLPSGSPAYVALHRHATLKIDDFCAKHGVERLAVEQEVPVLRDLEALTHAESPVMRLRKGLGLFIAGFLGALTIGAAGGLVTTGYHWVVRLLVR
jgi:hypothetical protein